MGLHFTAEQLQHLELRAARISRTQPNQAEPVGRLVTFLRAETRYAVLASDLRRARVLPKVTRLPSTPAHLLGVVNLGGHALGAVDLERLQRPQAPLPARPWALWVSQGSQGIVLVADELHDVIDLPLSQLTTELRGAFAGRLASLVRAVLPGPLLLLDCMLLLKPELYRPLER